MPGVGVSVSVGSGAGRLGPTFTPPTPAVVAVQCNAGTWDVLVNTPSTVTASVSGNGSVTGPIALVHVTGAGLPAMIHEFIGSVNAVNADALTFSASGFAFTNTKGVGSLPLANLGVTNNTPPPPAGGNLVAPDAVPLTAPDATILQAA